MQTPPTSPFNLSLEALRRHHASKYRLWVLVGISASLLGYTSSSVSFTVQRSWATALASGDPFVALVDIMALVLLFRGFQRLAASLALGVAFVDAHYSLFVLPMPTLPNVGIVVPAFVLTAGLLFGGRAAFGFAGFLMLSVPATLWGASLDRRGEGLSNPAVVHFLVVLEVVLVATTALLWAYLRTFAEILDQQQATEGKSRELLARLQHAQKLEAVGLLAGGIAHDFNNLLTAIGGYGSLLGRSSDLRARDLGAQIVAAQQRGATLTRQLLAFARKDIPQPRPIDLARVLAGLTGLLQRAVTERVRVHVEAEPDCVIVADPGRVEQVIFNLAVNARDAMPEGGALFIRCTRTESQVRLEVEDEGVGMDEETQTRVFEPFFTTKGRHQGTGLGLSTVHGVVADSSGSIELTSAVGRGTRFVILWPRSALAPAGETEEPVDVRGDGRTVLLVEDNDGARAYMERLLVERGFRVTAARSAEDALGLVGEGAACPDLLLTDVILPGANGAELARSLRARWPTLSVLFVSGYLGDIALGSDFDPATDIVPKPFTSAELLSRVARRIQGHADSGERRVSVG